MERRFYTENSHLRRNANWDAVDGFRSTGNNRPAEVLGDIGFEHIGFDIGFGPMEVVAAPEMRQPPVQGGSRWYTYKMYIMMIIMHMP